MPLGNLSPCRSTVPDTQTVRGVWTGGGAAANCTKAATDVSKGIASVNYNAATGKYLITFTDVGSAILDGEVNIMRPAGTAPLQANVVFGSLDRSAKTLQFEVWDTATPSLTAVALTDKLCITVVFSKNGP